MQNMNASVIFFNCRKKLNGCVGTNEKQLMMKNELTSIKDPIRMGSVTMASLIGS